MKSAKGLSRRQWLKAGASTACVALLATLTPVCVAQSSSKTLTRLAPDRPNVVVILVDDMGFSDIASFGGEIPTPNLDALAAKGLRFSQFYNSARCSPSRASLLTGTYPHQAGLGHLEGIAPPGARGIQGQLANRVVTMAEVLRGAGYRTAMAGKWHLGLDRGVTPWTRGFDRSLTSPIGELYYRDQPQPATRSVYIDGRRVASSAPEVGAGYWYSSDMFVDWSSRFINEAKEQKKPFFLYLPFVSPHFPVMAPQEDVARYKGRYRRGWEALRKERFGRQQAMGLFNSQAALTRPMAGAYDWNKLSDQDKERFDTIMAVYAACIERMDKAVGTLVDRLRASGELDNTLLMFMSDNGGNAESGPDGRLQGKGLPGDAQSNIFVGMNWASLQNTPYRYFKHFTQEGGIATPLIVHWPKGIDPALSGSFVRAPGLLIDVMPTVVEASGATYPRSFGGNEIVAMQGRSMLPAFKGKPLARNRPIFWEHEGHRAVRDGRWKLVAQFGQTWQLYDMEADPTEITDLAKRHPKRVAAMVSAWDGWARRSYVDTWTDAFDPWLKGRPRPNWGTVDTPANPDAQIR